MNNMFDGCINLKTIFVGDMWIPSNVTKSQNMFDNCAKLIGCKGSRYDKQQTDLRYAHIDGGINNPGYLSKTFEKIEFSKLPIKKEYLEGEPLSIDDGIILVTWKDKSIESFSFNVADVSGFDANSVGKQQLQVDYLGIKTFFEITVKAKSPLSIEISKFPVVDYIEGSDLVLSGGILTVNYNNGTTEDIALSNATITGFNNTTIGEQTLTVRFCELETFYTVNVKKKTIISIEMFKQPQIEYHKGSDLILSDGQISVKYDNGTIEYIPLTQTVITGFDNTKLGEQELTVSYLGMQTTFIVSVADLTPISIEVDAVPTKYIEGSISYFAGATLKVIYENNYSEIIQLADADYISDFDNSKLGEQEITVSYHGLSTSFIVTVIPKTVESIEYIAEPVKKQYFVGEDLNLEGGLLNVTYNNYTSEFVSLSSANITGYNKDKLGIQIITATYLGYSFTFEVNVSEICAVSMEVTKLPQTDYIIGEDLNLNGGEVTIVYNNSTTEIINLSMAEVLGYDKNQIGAQNLEVVYNSFLTTFSVTVYPSNNPNTPISSVSNNISTNVWSSNYTIYINAPTDTKYKIIDTNGRIIATSTTTSNHTEIKINKSGVLLVIINGTTYKVII